MLENTSALVFNIFYENCFQSHFKMTPESYDFLPNTCKSQDPPLLWPLDREVELALAFGFFAMSRSPQHRGPNWLFLVVHSIWLPASVAECH